MSRAKKLLNSEMDEVVSKDKRVPTPEEKEEMTNYINGELEKINGTVLKKWGNLISSSHLSAVPSLGFAGKTSYLKAYEVEITGSYNFNDKDDVIGRFEVIFSKNKGFSSETFRKNDLRGIKASINRHVKNGSKPDKDISDIESLVKNNDSITFK